MNERKQGGYVASSKSRSNYRRCTNDVVLSSTRFNMLLTVTASMTRLVVTALCTGESFLLLVHPVTNPAYPYPLTTKKKTRNDGY
jgi:hypothetical protein